MKVAHQLLQPLGEFARDLAARELRELGAFETLRNLGRIGGRVIHRHRNDERDLVGDP